MESGVGSRRIKMAEFVMFLRDDCKIIMGDHSPLEYVKPGDG